MVNDNVCEKALNALHALKTLISQNGLNKEQVMELSLSMDFCSGCYFYDTRCPDYFAFQRAVRGIVAGGKHE